MNKWNSIAHLKELLCEELPGEKAHLRMLPYLRELRPLRDHTQEIQESAVLILIWWDQSYKTCVIKRNSDMRNHAGQFALPGGKFDSQLDHNLKQTAIRETKEEIGVELAVDSIIGNLTKIYIPVSNFYITPYVAFVQEKPSFVINQDEVEKIVQINLNEMFSSKGEMTVAIKGHEMSVPSYNYFDTKIWGATAMILSEFEEIWKTLKKRTIRC